LAGVSLLPVDEAARVKDEMFVALEPMPAVGDMRLVRFRGAA
jgi:hypothetical protein